MLHLPATIDGHFEDMMSSDHKGAACFRQKRFWIRRAVLWLDSQDQTSTMAPTRACADHLQPQRSDRLTILVKGKCVLDRVVHNKAADTTSPERLDIASLRIATTVFQETAMLSGPRLMIAVVIYSILARLAFFVGLDLEDSTLCAAFA